MKIYLDVISPYAYLAWSQVRTIAARHGRTVTPVPVLFAAMLDAFGTIGPAEVPVKRSYLWKDVLRKASLVGAPLVPPPAHPFLPLVPLRVATAAPEADRAAVLDALFGAFWGKGRAIDTPEGAREALEAAGLDVALVERANDAAVKGALKAATEDAIARGIFGVPTVEVDGERFWGNDALPSLEAFLRGEDPVTPEILERFAAVPIGVTRAARAKS